MTEPRFRKGDVVDIVFRRAIVDHVNHDGRLQLVHTDEEFYRFNADALDVEVTVVGNVRPGEPGFIDGLRLPLYEGAPPAAAQIPPAGPEVTP